MNLVYSVTGLVLLIFVVVVQVIRMNIYVLRMGKDSELGKARIKEDEDWEFIKGLY